jgi:hypothetical protein
MSQKKWLILFGLSLCALLTALTPQLRAQSGAQGKIAAVVEDSTGAVIPDAHLELTALATNDVRTATTQSQGNYQFVGLPIGTYKLRASKNNYTSAVLETVQVHASQTTGVTLELKIGNAQETVSVSAEATPLLDTSSNSIGQVIDLKMIEDLPMAGRSLTALSSLTAGFTGIAGTTTGVWNGQQFSNQGSNVDGVVGQPTRSKYVGAVDPSATPRLENIAEMSVVTDQLDLDQGFGMSTMQINFVTRAGTNAYHGRLFEDARNNALYANTYAHKVQGLRRDKVVYHDFGGSLGGPILHDKLFFFGGVSAHRDNSGTTNSNSYLTSAAQSGNFTYQDTNGASQTVNLLSIAKSYNTANNTSLPTAVNGTIASEISSINSSLSAGATSTGSDTNINTVSWQSAQPNHVYYPTVRVDYNVSQKLRMNLAVNMTTQTTTGSYTPNFPGSSYAGQGGSYHTRSYTAAYGIDYTITPNLINQFKAGYLYNMHQYAVDAKPYYASSPTIYWDLDSYGSYNMSGDVFTLPTTNYYPVFNVSDSMSWQKGAHAVKLGFSGYREQDHYWNPPAGFNNIYLGMASGDPAANAFDTSAGGSLPLADNNTLAEAQQFYSTLTGRISYVGGSYAYDQKSGSYANGISAYNLDERQTAWGLFAQDSWKFRRNLTLNYGLRWDFTGDNYDLTGAYHSLSEASIYGPSGINNLFNPGIFTGISHPTIDARQHAYAPWHLTPQPSFGFTWNPDEPKGWLSKLVGNNQTVVRGGFSLRRYTMPQQFYWNNASAYGAFFYQSFYLEPNTTGAAGTYTPGSLSLGDTLPAFGLSPASYQKSEALADFTFTNSLSMTGMDPHIKQPYTQSWNIGIERQLGHGALEIRYNGNRSLHQWLAINPNEVNIFENGFLDEFKKAQANYKANVADGVSSFAYRGLTGQSKLPTFDAAFTGEAKGSDGKASDYTYSSFLTYIKTGQAGAMASTLSGVNGTTTYFCNLVGVSFSPCSTNAGSTSSGAGYATNFFQANPYAAGQSTSYMTAAGYSSYHALQVDYRLQNWKGLSFDANYTYGKTLGIGSTRSWTAGGDNLMTLRNMHRSYGPTPYDIRQVFHWNGTYDLPLGKGKAFLGSNRIVSRVVSDWTVGSILTLQSGAPQQLYGGYATYNDYADGGVTLSGVTRKQLQKSVGVHRVAGKSYAQIIDPKYLKSKTSGGANTTYINSNTTPGTIGDVIFLYGPHAFYHDVSLSKSVAVHDTMRFRLQGEFLNVWNHPVFGSTPSSMSSGYVQSNSFGLAGVTNTPRRVEIRANFEF